MRQLTDEEKTLAIELASAGQPIDKIRKAINMVASEFHKYRLENPTFENQFARARQEGLEELADQLLEVTEKFQDVQKARVHSENIRWVLSKRKPHVYGDRIDLNVNQTIDIGSALQEARKRALLPDSYQETPRVTQVVETISLPIPKQADCLSVSDGDATDNSSEDIFK